VLALLGLFLHSSPLFASDPVQELARALQTPADDAQARRAAVEKSLQALRGANQLHQALELGDWRDDELDRDVARGDRRLREQVARRLLEKLKTLLESGDPTIQLAAATLIGELGTEIRDTKGEQTTPPRGLMCRLAPDLVKRTQQGSPEVRQAAARSLGTIDADPEAVVPALSAMLRASDAELRRAAAAGLVNLVQRTVSFLARGGSPAGIMATWTRMLKTAAAAVPAAVLGLRDADVEVRRRAGQTIEVAAEALRDYLLEPLQGNSRAATGDPLQPGKSVGARRAEEQAEVAALRELTGAIADRITDLDAGLEDGDIETRLTVNRTLEAMADAWGKWQLPSADRAQLAEKRAAFRQTHDAVRGALMKVVPALAKELSHADVRVRLASLYVLESMRSASAPAIGELTKTLADADPFVRWGAARALGNLVPPGAGPDQELVSGLAKAAPALARFLEDENRDIRVTAAAALERFGPAARPAAESLARAVHRGDEETRVRVIHTLAAVGPDARADAGSALVKALRDPETPVRLAAARALERWGPAEGHAADALRKALGDSDPEVRRAAGDALLVGK
jgi:HEAT repeat protein